MWFAGIDWADRYHDTAVMTATGEVAGRLEVAHSAEGLEQLIRRRIIPLDNDSQLPLCQQEAAHILRRFRWFGRLAPDARVPRPSWRRRRLPYCSSC